MITRILKRGCHGDDVLLWQHFLRGEDLYTFECDGSFGKLTAAATANFQTKYAISPVDGVVGSVTLGRALGLGLTHFQNDDEEQPILPPGLRPLGTIGRIRKFGTLYIEPAGTPENPEAVQEKSGWAKENIVTSLFFLAGQARSVSLHRIVKEPFTNLLAAWEKAGLSSKILTFDGAWNMRFIRGSRSTLSAHAWGSALDINQKWNGLGKEPARGEGSVLSLVPIALDLGWYWGGFFSKKDGMHLEYVG